MLCRVPLDMGGGIRSCDITDPYVVVLLVDGKVALLRLQEQEGAELSPTLNVTWPELAKGSQVTLISAYTDTSGLFVTNLEEVESVGVAGDSGEPELLHQQSSIDDEDELLYGDVNKVATKMMSNRERSVITPPKEKATPTPTNWCALYREDGSLEIYEVPSFTVVLCVRNFSSHPRTLKDSGTFNLE